MVSLRDRVCYRRRHRRKIPDIEFADCFVFGSLHVPKDINLVIERDLRVQEFRRENDQKKL